MSTSTIEQPVQRILLDEPEQVCGRFKHRQAIKIKRLNFCDRRVFQQRCQFVAKFQAFVQARSSWVAAFAKADFSQIL
ncbi:hypothetical protein D3C80_1665040 [compost metagenome]